MKYMSLVLSMLYAMCCFFPKTTEASSTMWERVGGPDGGIFGSVYVYKNSLIASTGGYGGNYTFYLSKDLGETWTEIGPKPLRKSSYDIILIDSTIMLDILGGPLRSENNAKTWSKMTIDSSTYSEQHVVFTGAFDIVFSSTESPGDSTVYRSVDRGISWSPIKLPGKFDITKMITTGKTLSLYRYNQMIQSTDSGKTWSRLQLPLHDTVTIHTVTSIGKKILLGASDGIHISDNSGSSWYSPSNSGLPENPDLLNLKSAGKNVYALLAGPEYYKSSDTGSTWETLKVPGKVNFVEMAIENDIIAFAYRVNGYHTISTSIDCGSTWNTFQLRSFSARISVAVLKGYIFCIDGDGIYRSSDSGRTFVKSSHGIFNADLFGIAKSSQDLYAATNIGLYKSSDDDHSWEIQEITSDQLPFDPVFNVGKGSNYLYASTFRKIYSLPDGSTQWHKDTIFNAPTSPPVEFMPFLSIDKKTYFAYFIKDSSDTAWDTTGALSGITDYTTCNSAHFISTFFGAFRLQNNGKNWHKIYDGKIHCLASNNHTLYGGLDSNTIIYSNDNGEKWMQMHPNLPPLQTSIPVCNQIENRIALKSMIACKNYLFIAYNIEKHMCQASNSFVSPDNGNTWQSLSNQLPYVVNRFQIFDDKLYASTQFGGVWRLNLSELSNADQPAQFGHQAEQFSYEITGQGKRYNTALKVNLFDRTRVSASLYSITGKKAASLVNGFFDPGNYSFSLDDSNLSHGCYILSLCIGHQVRNIALQLVR